MIEEWCWCEGRTIDVAANTQRDSRELTWLHMIQTGAIVREEGFGVHGGFAEIHGNEMGVENQGESEQS